MAFEAFWFAQKQENAPHEAGLLRLDSTRIHETLGWRPKWDSKTAVSKAVEWYVNYATNKDLTEITKNQIQEYFNI